MQMTDVSEFEGGQIRLWIEQEAIHMLACDMNHRDPVELTGGSARELAAKLNELADTIDR